MTRYGGGGGDRFLGLVGEQFLGASPDRPAFITAVVILSYVWIWTALALVMIASGLSVMDRNFQAALIFTNSSSQPLTVANQSQLRQFGANFDVLSGCSSL